MNLVDKLMKADAKKIDEKTTGTFKSYQLARILGESDPVEIELQEISSRRQTELIASAVKDDGGVDVARTYDANLKVVIAGVVNPPLKDKELQDHFGCKMAIDLAEKLFKSEVTDIAAAILDLGKVGDVKTDEEEIKN